MLSVSNFAVASYTINILGLAYGTLTNNLKNCAEELTTNGKMQKSGHPHFWVDIISQSFILKFNYKHAKKQIEKGPLKFIKKEILFQLNLMHIVS